MELKVVPPVLCKHHKPLHRMYHQIKEVAGKKQHRSFAHGTTRTGSEDQIQSGRSLPQQTGYVSIIQSEYDICVTFSLLCKNICTGQKWKFYSEKLEKCITSSSVIHFLLRGGVCPSRKNLRGKVHPGLVTNLSQDSIYPKLHL